MSINEELKYPVMARRNRIQGQCMSASSLITDTLSSIAGGETDWRRLRDDRGWYVPVKFNKPDYAVPSPTAHHVQQTAAGSPFAGVAYLRLFNRLLLLCPTT
jgi:hypothetical protein